MPLSPEDMQAQEYIQAVGRENLVMFVGIGLYTVLNYFGQRFFAFK